MLLTVVLLVAQCHGAATIDSLAPGSPLCSSHLRVRTASAASLRATPLRPLGGRRRDCRGANRLRSRDATELQPANARVCSRPRMSSADDALGDAWLDSETTAPETQLTRQFREWRAQLEAEGWWEREPLAEAARLATWALAVAAGAVCAWSGLPLAPRNALAVLALAAANSRAGWLGHDYRHGKDAFCKWMRPFSALAVGVGATFWFKREHDAHHAAVNVVGVDRNLLAANVVWLWPPNEASDRPWRRWQHVYLPFTLVALFPALRLQSLQFAWRYRAERDIGATELAPLLLHYPLLYAACGCSLLRMIAVVALSSVFTSIIALSLHHAEALYFERQPEWVVAQLGATRNRRLTNPLSEWIWGGMNYHIEHHLFPTMPSSKYSKLAPLLKDWCEARGLAYGVDHELDVLRRNFALYKAVAEAPVDSGAPSAMNA